MGGGLGAHEMPGHIIMIRMSMTRAMKDMIQNGNHSIRAFSISSNTFIRNALGPDGVYSESRRVKITCRLELFVAPKLVYKLFVGYNLKKACCGHNFIYPATHSPIPRYSIVTCQCPGTHLVLIKSNSIALVMVPRYLGTHSQL